MKKEDNTIVLGTKHFLFGALIIGLIVGFVLLGRAPTEENSLTGQVVKDDTEKQLVKVSMTGNTYIFEPSTVKKGIPVKMEVDLNSVFGCYRSMVIPTLKVNKFVSEGDNVLEFVPKTKGTMKVSCSMGMGSGSFEVV